jgi:hypothetical protein
MKYFCFIETINLQYCPICYFSIPTKVTVISVFKYHAMEQMRMESKATAPHILNFGTRWR